MLICVVTAGFRAIFVRYRVFFRADGRRRRAIPSSRCRNGGGFLLRRPRRSSLVGLRASFLVAPLLFRSPLLLLLLLLLLLCSAQEKTSDARWPVCHLTSSASVQVLDGGDAKQNCNETAIDERKMRRTPPLTCRRCCCCCCWCSFLFEPICSLAAFPIIRRRVARPCAPQQQQH